MDASRSPAFDRALGRVIDGYPVDWECVLEEAVDQRERALIEELRGVAQLDASEAGESGLDVQIRDADANEGPQLERWRHLELRAQIGRGAYGTVHRAWDTRLAREVALKLIADDTRGSIEEARRLARVTHPNIVSIYGTDRLDGQVGLWMELLRGRTLDAILRDQGPFSVRETVGMAVDICGALAAIHRAGLIHRDIKAQNVMREPGGRLVLMDLGTSLDVTHDDEGVRTLAGTPLYMAPELFDGAKADVRSDIYAMGVLMYRLVTAEFPVQALTIGDVRRAHATAALRPLRAVRPELSPSFVDVVERCLAADPSKRYDSVSALEGALRRIEETVRTPNRVKAIAWTVGVGLSVALFAWGALRVRNDGSRAVNASTFPAPTPSISPDQYKVFVGYEELAFDKRQADPRGASAALDGAWDLTRELLPGNQPLFGLLQLQSSEALRRAGDVKLADEATTNAGANLLLSVGEDHPYTALLAMELARNAQAVGDHRTAAAQIRRALHIRWRVLGLTELLQRRVPRLDAARLEEASRRASCDLDSDGDGLPDCLEVAAGLDAHSLDSDGNGLSEDDERFEDLDVSNRLALGGLTSPFLTWAQYGAHEPRYAGWQTPPRFPMVERGAIDPPRWSLEALHGQGYFNQRFARAQSSRALESGFSLLARVQPVEGATGLDVDTAPIGPRFDLTVRRINAHSIEICLVSSLVPLAGRTVTIESEAAGPGPLLELRFRPQWQSAALYVDGRRVADGYKGHHQFQDPQVGVVSLGLMNSKDSPARAKTSVNLLWLEIL
jgi:hypothetical protein